MSFDGKIPLFHKPKKPLDFAFESNLAGIDLDSLLIQVGAAENFVEEVVGLISPTIADKIKFTLDSHFLGLSHDNGRAATLLPNHVVQAFFPRKTRKNVYVDE